MIPLAERSTYDPGCGTELKRVMNGLVMRFRFSVRATGNTGWKIRFEFQRVSSDLTS